MTDPGSFSKQPVLRPGQRNFGGESLRGPQVPVTEQSFPCPLCPVAFVLHHMRARVIYKTFLAGGGGQYLDPQPRAVPYIDKLLHLFHWHCSFPPHPPDFNIGRMAKSPWAPQRLPTKCRTTELFRPARTEPNIKIGGMGGEHTSDGTTMRKSAGHIQSCKYPSQEGRLI